MRAGKSLPERRGFLFGIGAFVRATELAQKAHGLGFFSHAGVGVTLAGAAAGTLFGGPGNSWRRGEAARVSFAEGDRWFVVMASTLKRFPLGLKPFGEPREGLKVLTVTAPPRGLLQALPVLLGGGDASRLVRRGYRRDDLTQFDVDVPGDFVLDGEIYEGGALTVRQGPELEFVIP